MSSPRSLSDDERRRLLNDMATLKSDDDDAVAQDPKWFLPLDSHARALRPETLVVRGGRGAGKSSLFHFLSHVQRRPALADRFGIGGSSPVEWVEGFSSALDHPSFMVVGNFGNKADDDAFRFFWFAWLCARLAATTGTPLPPGPLLDASKKGTRSPEELSRAGELQLEELSRWLDDVDRSRSVSCVVTYDSLDRLGSAHGRRGLTASLLAMWLSLADRYRRIRPKIFVREDLFQASLSAFPDASKLDARSTSIEWRVEDLYRVLIKHMANTSDDLRRWVEGSTRGIPLNFEDDLGWLPPKALPETGKASQKNFVDHLAGEQMGSGSKKGYTYRWIPNRLQDAHTRVVPRSILSLLRYASEFAVNRGPEAQSLRLLTPTELQGALEKTSRRRVEELKEEFPVVLRLENLRGKTVLLDRKYVVNALGRAIEDSEDEHGEDGEMVLRTLIELGVMSERADGRIDVPDIYRYGFGIMRMGGVKRPR